jgi:hypothetical protein
MSVSRRDLLLMSMGLLATGCASENANKDRPSPNWPTQGDRPKPAGALPASRTPAGAGATARGNLPPTPTPPAVAPQPPSFAPGAAAGGGPLRAIPRSSWTRAAIIPDRINPMEGVNRITVHHEGWKVVNYTDAVTTAERLDEIRASHLQRLNAGDIAYHYIVDRGGRLWQGRDIRYQGAHVRSENEHNVGVMCLGNFEEQSPTDVQIKTLRETLVVLIRHFRVPISRVYTHQELNATACPGRALQPKMVQLRRGGYLT